LPTAALLVPSRLSAAAVNLDHPDHYFHWGIVVISPANLIVIAVLMALFIAALALPFMRARTVPASDAPETDPGTRPPGRGSDRHGWTGAVRDIGLRLLPPTKLLPGRT